MSHEKSSQPISLLDAPRSALPALLACAFFGCSAGAPPPAASPAAPPPPAASADAGATTVPAAAPTSAPAAPLQAAPPQAAPLPLGPARVLWTVEPVDHTDYYKLDVVPGAFVAVLGQNTHGVSSPDDMFVSALSEDGAVLWHEAGTAAYTRAVSASREGLALVTEFSGKLDYQGQRAHSDSSAAFIAKLDDKGKIAWGRTLATPAFTRVDGIALTSDGGVVTSLGIFAPAKRGPLAVRVAGGRDTVIVAYDKAGEVAWTHVFNFAGYDDAASLFVDPAGDVVVAGTLYQSDSNWRMAHSEGTRRGWVTKIGPKGERRWLTDLGQGPTQLGITRLVPAPGGEIIVTGTISGKQRLGAVELDAPAKDGRFVAHLGSDGKVLSARLREPRGQYEYDCIAVDAAGRMIVTEDKGIFEEAIGGKGERKQLLAFPDAEFSSVSDCRLDGKGHLYIAARARPGAKIGDKTLTGPLKKRPRTSWLKDYSVGFVAKVALSPEVATKTP